MGEARDLLWSEEESTEYKMFIYQIGDDAVIQLEKYETFLQETLTVRFEKSMNLFMEEYQHKKQQIDSSFIEAVDELCIRGAKMQEKEQKGDIAVISIFNLKSSILTSEHKLQINLYDENFYLDRKDIFKLWDCSFLMKYFEDDMQYIRIKANHNLVGFRYEDYQLLKLQYSEFYNMILAGLCEERAEEIVRLTSYKNMKKKDGTVITYGGYMDKGVLLYPAEPEKGIEE